MGGASRRQAVRSSIIGFVVSPGAVVCTTGTDRALEVKIHSCDPSDIPAIITKETRVELRNDDTEDMDNLSTAISKLELASPPPNLNLKPLAGLEQAYHGLVEITLFYTRYGHYIDELRLRPPQGVLLHGPPGTGKTFLVSRVAKDCNALLIALNGPDVQGSAMGETEENLRKLFSDAQQKANSGSRPVILFIDEIDALVPRRKEASSSENRTVAQMLTLMDGIESRGKLVVVGATNFPNNIDPALRRPGRLEREVAIDVPGEGAREAILRSLTGRLPIAGDVDFAKLAVRTNGYVAADLVALCREAAMGAAQQSLGDAAVESISATHFDSALGMVVPSTQRGETVNVDVKLSWDDIGGLEEVKHRLRQAVEWPLLYRDSFKLLGLKPPRGVLLYGPPGCSKTTLVKVIAATSGATFLSLNGAQMYSPFVGDSELAVRNTFERARRGAPSVVFFDEVDAIVGKRGLGSGGSGKGDTVQERLLSTLLNEMDGVESADNVLVVGATNRPDMVDAALMRPGRFDRVIYVPPPDAAARLHILQIHTKKMPLAPDLDLHDIATHRTERFSGADLQSVCREAAMEALRSHREADVVMLRHFEAALATVKASLSIEMLKQYEAFAQKYGAGK
ncbi:P-loop containing nucleoside triphosphate hydrolase protein [Phlyctochytrium arcticum]|nr:P-loop containing nucleoside triphosphate hydrolase protein [Phlyctochytrium arcticum]